jgi:hypothetical protein
MKKRWQGFRLRPGRLAVRTSGEPVDRNRRLAAFDLNLSHRHDAASEAKSRFEKFEICDCERVTRTTESKAFNFALTEIYSRALNGRRGGLVAGLRR